MNDFIDEDNDAWAEEDWALGHEGLARNCIHGRLNHACVAAVCREDFLACQDAFAPTRRANDVRIGGGVAFGRGITRTVNGAVNAAAGAARVGTFRDVHVVAAGVDNAVADVTARAGDRVAAVAARRAAALTHVARRNDVAATALRRVGVEDVADTVTAHAGIRLGAAFVVNGVVVRVTDLVVHHGRITHIRVTDGGPRVTAGMTGSGGRTA